MSERIPNHRTLSPFQRALYATGDFTINAALNALAFVFTAYFLIHVANLRPALAGLVPLIGRALDALTDPIMGRISDRTPWRWGRRRPYFVLGALPFGLSFALLWTPAPFEHELSRFAYYTAVYCLLTTAMTVLAIPYLALQPEMSLTYDDRTSLNTYRAAGAILGVFAAIAVRPLANFFGGGPEGFQAAGVLLGLLFVLPWVVVYLVSFERPEMRYQGDSGSFFQGLVDVLRHGNFRRLLALFLFSRMAIDVISTVLILYFGHWLGRPYDFERGMLLFLLAVVCALPVWLSVARKTEKTTLFTIGASTWALVQCALLFVQPDSPRWLVFVLMVVAGAGYAAVDVMPWSMIGEVIDEDELLTGHRREGLYNGVFTFVRKLAGASGVFLVLTILDVLGFQPNTNEGDTPRDAIRWLAGLGPLTFLAMAILSARRYALTRAVHRGIVAELWERRRRNPPGSASA